MSTVLTSAAEAVSRTLRCYGIEASPLADLAALKFDGEDPGARLDTERFHGFVAAAAEASGDEAFGLSLARQFAVFNYHLHFVMAACPDLAAATEQYVEYQQFIGGGLNASFHHREVEFELEFGVPEPDEARGVPTDTMTGAAILAGRSLSLQPRLSPIRIESRRPESEAIKVAYAELFDCPVSFGQPRNRLIFDAQVMTNPLPTANALMLQRAETVMANYAAALNTQKVKHRLVQLLSSELRNGVPRKQAMARRLGLSDRSLGRHLAAEGTSYREVLEEVRSTIARQYLTERSASVTEVAFLLGFSDSTAFSRAFRRWTGIAPGAYAQEMSSI